MNNTSTPSKTLEEFSKDSDVYVRYGVAWNTSASSKTLEELAEDSNIDILNALQKNPKLDIKIKEMIFILTGIEYS